MVSSFKYLTPSWTGISQHHPIDHVDGSFLSPRHAPARKFAAYVNIFIFTRFSHYTYLRSIVALTFKSFHGSVSQMREEEEAI